MTSHSDSPSAEHDVIERLRFVQDRGGGFSELAQECITELTQLRRIDKAARAFVEAPAGAKAGKAYRALSEALFNGDAT